MPLPRIEPKEREVNTTYAVYGNGTANDCLEALDEGHVVRLLIGAGERAFVTDHVRLTSGEIAVTNSKFEPRRVLEATEAELGYGVAKAHTYVYLPYDYSLFATDLEEPQFSDGFDPAEIVPVSFAENRDLMTDGGQSMGSTDQSSPSTTRNLSPPQLEHVFRPLGVTLPPSNTQPICVDLQRTHPIKNRSNVDAIVRHDLGHIEKSANTFQYLRVSSDRIDTNQDDQELIKIGEASRQLQPATSRGVRTNDLDNSSDGTVQTSRQFDVRKDGLKPSHRYARGRVPVSLGLVRDVLGCRTQWTARALHHSITHGYKPPIMGHVLPYHYIPLHLYFLQVTDTDHSEGSSL